jgi:hypothetical protein
LLNAIGAFYNVPTTLLWLHRAEDIRARFEQL